MKKIIIIVLVVAGIYQWTNPSNTTSTSVPLIASKATKATKATMASNNPSAFDSKIEQAYKNRQSDVQVQGLGKVIRILPDDNKGSRHQRFILKLANGQTLLIAHNIDLAAKITSLSTGDQVESFGANEWNNKGGVVHRTHHDPRGRHVGGGEAQWQNVSIENKLYDF